ncbi:MAG TPA: MBOAT family O-acyltransferase [Candidatus Sulfotelmatobacter sp.]|nr:MBOAT family O-acyltransferase [Candidatus Sulfotelmatobacter sp.]
MPFNSVLYLIFLVAAVTVYWLLPHGLRRVFVFAASLAFYASWGVIFVWLPLLVAGIVYLFGTRIQFDSEGARRWMWLGIGCVLSLLIVFKYRAFVLSNLNVVFAPLGTHSSSWVTAIAFPMGISFYTLEAIAYLVDVRQGRVKIPSFLDLCLFFLFWPNILSGPILRARELIPQLSFRKPFESRFVFEGLDRVVWGLVQKNVVANMLGIWVDKGFAPAAGIPFTFDAWFLAVAFGLQIYFDFAGYTNLAIGAARLLGVTLPENFRQPYHAATPPDFWARWHMTLSRWIRDYLFFPVNARWHGAPLPLYLSLLGVMALVGLWHGAGWNYILWGSLHGTYLIAYRVYESWKTERPSSGDSWLAAGTWRLVTLVAVTAAWVPFRASTLSKAGIILSSMFYRLTSGRAYSAAFYVFTLVVLLFCALEPLLLRKLSEIEERAGADGLSPFHVMGRPLAYACGLLLFLLFDEHNTQFIYSQF